MTPLRHEIESAKQEYRSAKYPGDLAIDTLLNRRVAPGRWPVALAGFAVGAIAASVAVVLFLQFSAVKPDPGAPVAQNPGIAPASQPVVAQSGVQEPVVGTSSTSDSTSATNGSTTSKITMEDIGMTPRSYEMTPPAMPSFPTWDSLCTPGDSGSNGNTQKTSS